MSGTEFNLFQHGNNPGKFISHEGIISTLYNRAGSIQLTPD